MQFKELPRQSKINYLSGLIITTIIMVILLSNMNQALIRNRGGLALLHGDLIKAKSIFENVDGSGKGKYWHLYGIYAQMDYPDQAGKALELAGYDWQMLMKLGESYIWPTQDYAKALRWFSRAQAVNENSTILFKQGQIYELMGEPLLAKDFYIKALQMNTFETEDINVSNDLVRLASIYHVEFDDAEEVWNLTNQALELDQFGTYPEDKAQAYYLQGQIESDQGSAPSLIIEKYELALSSFPEHYWANLMLGWEYYRAERPLDEAVNQIHHAISLNPDNKWGYLILGGIYVNVGKLREAKELYEQVLLLDPNDLTAVEFIQNNP